MKSEKSTGVDNVSTNFVKQLKTSLSGPLCVLMNRSFVEGSFPSALKRAKTIPIFKKKGKYYVDNYRPISLLPVFGKIFEKAFCARLVSFLSDHDALYESQYSFRRGRSTTNTISELYLNVINAMLNNEFLLATFIDFSKAFDTIEHATLLRKLPWYMVFEAVRSGGFSPISQAVQWLSAIRVLSQKMCPLVIMESLKDPF